MRQWRKTATGGLALHVGEQPIAYVCAGAVGRAGTETQPGPWAAWPTLCTGVDGIFPSADHPNQEAAKAYVERQVDLFLLRAELREV